MARRLWDKGEPLHPEILTYTVGEDFHLDLALVEEDCWGSLAHSQMLAEQGLIPHPDQRAIAESLREVLRIHRRGEFTIEPCEEDVHTAVEGWVTERCGDAGRRLHTGRSRNDQILVDMRIYMKRRLLEIGKRGIALARALLKLASDEQNTVLPGYTHMRQAMPSSVGLWAAGHAEGLEESLDAIWSAYQACDRCPLGSAAGFGVPIPLDRRRTAELLGFSRLQVNAQAVQTSRGRAESQALFAACLVGRDLATLAWDLQLWSGPEFGFVSLPGNVATGSSIMPQKRNPDVLELTRGNSAVLQSYLDRVMLVAGKLPSSYHRDYQLTKLPVVKGLNLVADMLRAMELTVEGLEMHRERCSSQVATEAFAAHEALAMVRNGIPFREAYALVGERLQQGQLERPQDTDAVRRLYEVEGSAGDLRLEDAQRRVDEIEACFGRARTELEACLAALETEAERSP